MNTFHEVEMPDHGLAEACRFRAVRNRTASTSHAGLLRGSLNVSNILDVASLCARHYCIQWTSICWRRRA